MAADEEQTPLAKLDLYFVSNHMNNETLMTCGKQCCSNDLVVFARAGKRSC